MLKRWAIRFLIFVLSITVLLFSAALSTWLTLKVQVSGDLVKTPHLYGLSKEEAIDKLEALDLIPEVDPLQKPSTLVEAGSVAYQKPTPGQMIKTKRKVELTLSSGAPERLMPDLKGQSIFFSHIMAEKLAYRVGKTAVVPHPLPHGSIVGQNPDPDTALQTHQTVNLLLSSGPQKPWYVAPDLIGQPLDAIKDPLESRGFRVSVRFRPDLEGLPNHVVFQSPKPGYPLMEHQNIVLHVKRWSR
jgi:serine/threonine-protein kinase